MIRVIFILFLWFPSISDARLCSAGIFIEGLGSNEEAIVEAYRQLLSDSSIRRQDLIQLLRSERYFSLPRTGDSERELTSKALAELKEYVGDRVSAVNPRLRGVLRARLKIYRRDRGAREKASKALPLRPPVRVVDHEDPWGLTISGDGKYLGFARKDNAATGLSFESVVLLPTDGREKTVLNLETDLPWYPSGGPEEPFLFFGPDFFLICAGIGECEARNLKTPQKILWHIDKEETSAEAMMDLSRDGRYFVRGRYFAKENEEHTLEVFDLSLWPTNAKAARTVIHVNFGERLTSVKFSPDGTKLLASNGRTRYYLVDWKNHKLSASKNTGNPHIGYLHYIAENLAVLEMNGADGTIAYNPLTGQSWSDPVYGAARAFGFRQGKLLTLDSSGAVTLKNPKTGSEYQAFDVGGSDSPGVFSADGTKFAVANANMALRLWDLDVMLEDHP